MFDSLGSKLQDTVQKLRGQDKITEANIDSALSEIRRNLIEADVSLKAVKLFTSRVREEALGSDVLRGVKPGEQLVKIIHDSLVEVLGGNLEEKQPDTDKPELKTVLDKLNLESNPSSILLLGLQGAGKTTTAAKLAYKLKAKAKKPLLIPCDLQRPAAVRQLQILAEQAQVDFLDITKPGSDPENENKFIVTSPLELVALARAKAKEISCDVLIFDTAGRLQIDSTLMAELLILEKQIKPDEKLLVIDSLIGQEAATVAQSFNTQIGLTGIILTKLDSDTKGGAALSVVEATQKPIKLASVGEKLEDLENFYPDRMASRILGMGDVLSLVEKAQEKISEEESKQLEAELAKGNFNYDTFVGFQNMLGKLGNFSSVFKMMGMGGMLKNMGLDASNQDAVLEQGQEKMSRYKIIISSMTKPERLKPELLSTDSTAKSRRARISKGSGNKDVDIASMTAEFTKMSKLFKQIGPMMSMMQGGGDDASAMQLNPMDMLGQMMGGMNKKQKKALQMSGMAGSLKAPKAKNKTKKSGKISIKGFNR
jgi:signal recognition particle subunit SRP54